MGSGQRIGRHVQEQRLSPRKVLRVRAALAMEDHAPMMGKTIDIGANGCSVNLPEPVLLGYVGQIAFDFMVDGQPVSIRTRVKTMYCIFSSGEFKAGLQFIDLDLPAVTALARYLK